MAGKKKRAVLVVTKENYEYLHSFFLHDFLRNAKPYVYRGQRGIAIYPDNYLKSIVIVREDVGEWFLFMKGAELYKFAKAGLFKDPQLRILFKPMLKNGEWTLHPEVDISDRKMFWIYASEQWSLMVSDQYNENIPDN